MPKNWKYARRIIAVGVVLLSASGCAIMSKSDCINGDWQSAGYHDANRGHTTERLTLRARACAKHGESSDEVMYQMGYNKGLEAYCTAERGLYLGSRNGDYRGICPAAVEGTFLRQYIYGLQIARSEITHRSFWLEDKLFSARFDRTRTDNSDDILRLTRHIDQIDNRLDTLHSARFQISRKIARWTTRLEGE